jgi:thiol-disulfide isomerase/thioredoxin
MAKIFISYRREDSEWPAHEIYTAIRRRLADRDEDVFIDVDHIPLGVDFKDYIDGVVAKCDVLLALIGRGWLEARDPESGNRRLDNPEDFVRLEIAAALERGVKVVPVLLDGTAPPRESQLPDDLKALSLRNGIEVNRASFKTDVERLITGLRIQPAAEPPAAGHADADARVLNTTDANYDTDVIQASNVCPVIVLFWASWCGVCARLKPELEKAVRELERPMRLVKLEVDENPSVPRDLNILAVPSVYSYYGGFPVDGFRGISSPSGLREFLNRQLERAGVP